MRSKKKENNFIRFQNVRVNVEDISMLTVSTTKDGERGDVDILFKNGIEKKISYNFEMKNEADFFKQRDKIDEILKAKDLNPEGHKYY